MHIARLRSLPQVEHMEVKKKKEESNYSFLFPTIGIYPLFKINKTTFLYVKSETSHYKLISQLMSFIGENLIGFTSGIEEERTWKL